MLKDPVELPALSSIFAGELAALRTKSTAVKLNYFMPQFVTTSVILGRRQRRPFVWMHVVRPYAFTLLSVVFLTCYASELE